MCRAVCENPQSGVTETLRGDVLQDRPDPLGHELGGLDPGVLDVDQATATSIVSGSSARSSISAISRLANSRAS